jgi:hypothetical protein
VPDSGKSPVADYLFENDTRDNLRKCNNPLIYGTPKLVAGKARAGICPSMETDDYLALTGETSATAPTSLLRRG